jgi:nucleoside phosphorylase
MIFLAYAYEPEVAAVRERLARLPKMDNQVHWVQAAGSQAGAMLLRAIDQSSGAASLVLNAGFAGTLQTDLAPGTVIQAASFTSPAAGSEVVPHCVALQTGLPQAKVLTVPTPLTEIDQRDRLRDETGASLVDMEGLHLASAAASRELDFISLKVVSDHADAVSWQWAVGRASKWSKILAEAVGDLLR